MSEKRPLIATGFIGRRLLEELPKQGFRVRVPLRRPTELPAGSASAVIGDIASPRNSGLSGSLALP